MDGMQNRRRAWGGALAALILAGLGWAQEATPGGLLQAAGKSFAQRDYARAAEQYQRLLQDRPDSPEAAQAAVRLGDCYRQAGDLERAAAAFAAVLKQYPATAPAASFGLGACRRDQGRFAEAADAFLAAARDPAQRENALAEALGAQMAAGQAEAATRTGNDFFREFPLSARRPEVLYLWACAGLELGRSESALAPLQELLRKHAAFPHLDDVRLRLADALLAEGRLAEAREGLLADPKLYERRPADTLRRLAEIQRCRGNAEGAAAAIPMYQLYLREFPDAPERDRIQYHLALTQLRFGPAAEGRATLEAMLRNYPRSRFAAAAVLQLAQASLQGGDPQSALAALARRLAECPEWTDEDLAAARFLQAQSWAAAQDFPRALAALDDLLRDGPGAGYDDLGRLARARCLARSGNYVDAAAGASGLLAHSPESPCRGLALLELGAALQSLGDLDRARPCLAEAAGHPAAAIPARYRLAWLYYGQADYAKAQPEFAALADAPPPFGPEARYLRARCLERLTQTAAALAAYRELAARPDAGPWAELAVARQVLLAPPAAGEAAWAEFAAQFPHSPLRFELSLQLAFAAAQAGEDNRALQRFQEALPLADPRTAEVRVAMGFCQLRQGRFDEAEKCFAAVPLNAGPGGTAAAAANLGLAEVAWCRGERENASRRVLLLLGRSDVVGERAGYLALRLAWQQGDLKLVGERAQAWRRSFPAGRYAGEVAWLASWAAFRQGDFESAGKFAAETAVAWPEAERRRLAVLELLSLARLGRWSALAETAANAQAAFPQAPEMPIYRYFAGLGVHGGKDPAAAQPGYEKLAADAGPGLLAALCAYRLGEIAQGLGQYAQAVRAFEQAAAGDAVADAFKAQALYAALEAARLQAPQEAAAATARLAALLCERFPDSDWAKKAAPFAPAAKP